MTEEPTERTSLLGQHSRARVKVSSDANSPRTPRLPGLSRDNSHLGSSLSRLITYVRAGPPMLTVCASILTQAPASHPGIIVDEAHGAPG